MAWKTCKIQEVKNKL